MAGVDVDEFIRRHREHRAQRAAQLRAQGLSSRQIAQRLGVSHATVLADLKTRQLSRDDLAGMTPEQIMEAYRDGALSDLMTGNDPQTSDTEEGDAK